MPTDEFSGNLAALRVNSYHVMQYLSSFRKILVLRDTARLIMITCAVEQ